MFDVLLFECPDLHPTRTWPRALKETNKRWIREGKLFFGNFKFNFQTYFRLMSSKCTQAKVEVTLYSQRREVWVISLLELRKQLLGPKVSPICKWKLLCPKYCTGQLIGQWKKLNTVLMLFESNKIIQNFLQFCRFSLNIRRLRRVDVVHKVVAGSFVDDLFHAPRLLPDW